MKECRFCHWVSLYGPRCRSCGAIDQVVPLEKFLRLQGVDRDRLSSIAEGLAAQPESAENWALLACLELSLGRLRVALPLLRKAARDEPASSSIRQLLGEVDLHCRSEAVAHAVLARERGQLGARKIILSVDDSATVRRVMEKVFSREGHVVVSVEDAESALTSLSELRPDIVFVDFQLPGLDGLALCRRVRQETSTLRLPVVILSGKGGEDLADLTRRAGADAFIRKPASPEMLLSLLRRLTAGPPTSLPAEA